MSIILRPVRRSVFASISNLIFFPLTFLGSICGGVFSSLTPRRSGFLSIFSFFGKIAALLTAAGIIIDPEIFSGLQHSSRSLLALSCIFFASLALCSTIYGLMRTFMVAGFWVAAILMISRHLLAPGEVMRQRAEKSFPQRLPGGLIYHDLTAGEKESGRSPAPGKSLDLGNTILRVLNPGNLLDQPLDYLSDITETGGLKFADSALLSFNSGVLPDSAYFPPAAKKRNFYPVEGTSSISQPTSFLPAGFLPPGLLPK